MDSQISLTSANSELLPTRKSKQTNISFVSKMQQILKDQDCRPYIQWSEDGTSFYIINNEKFTSYVLPKYFKHKNFNSFVRQLNMYGFRKIKSNEESFESCYSHHIFKRSENVAHKIKRLQPKKSESEDEENEYFIEKYSGTRNARKTETSQDSKVDVLRKQLTKLSEKFQDFEEVAQNLKSAIVMQNSQIKIMATELVLLRSEGENQYKEILNQFTGMQCKTKNIVVGVESCFPESQDSYLHQQSTHENGGQNPLLSEEEQSSSIQEPNFRKRLTQKNLTERYEVNLPHSSDKNPEAMRKLGKTQIFSKTIAVNDAYYFDYIQSQQGSFENSRDKMQSYSADLLEENSQMTGERELSSNSNHYEAQGEPMDQQAGYLVDDTYYGDNTSRGPDPYKMLQKSRIDGVRTQIDFLNDSSNNIE